MQTDEPPELFRTASTARRLAVLASSFLDLLRRPLVEASGDLTAALWRAPLAIVAHGTEDDPIFFFGNRLALDLFEMPAADFVRLPSRLSAEPIARDERQVLLDRVTRDGFIDKYAGVRISSSGRRFRIEKAIVWNLVDAAGACHGQAAAFDEWTRLDQ